MKQNSFLKIFLKFNLMNEGSSSLYVNLYFCPLFNAAFFFLNRYLFSLPSRSFIFHFYSFNPCIVKCYKIYIIIHYSSLLNFSWEWWKVPLEVWEFFLFLSFYVHLYFSKALLKIMYDVGGLKILLLTCTSTNDAFNKIIFTILTVCPYENKPEQH